MASNLKHLLDQKAALERQIADLQSSSRAEAIATIRTLMSEHGLTSSDLVASPAAARKASKASGSKVAPKFRHPATGATWTGRGLKPRWLAEELANGKTTAEFAL